MSTTTKSRCGWAGDDPEMVGYHDEEWGVPVHDRVRLFEMLTLEGAQAGLSWRTILRKREGYRAAFAGFDPQKVARFDARKVEALMGNERIVRNRLKIESTIGNARAILALEKAGSTLDAEIWSVVDGRPRVNRPTSMSGVPARTPESDALSKRLAKLGFRFVGSTICYALMQACGLVDDHLATCHCARRAKGARAKGATRSTRVSAAPRTRAAAKSPR